MYILYIININSLFYSRAYSIRIKNVIQMLHFLRHIEHAWNIGETKAADFSDNFYILDRCFVMRSEEKQTRVYRTLRRHLFLSLSLLPSERCRIELKGRRGRTR